MRENDKPVVIKDSRYRKMVKPYVDKAYSCLEKLVSINSVYNESTRSEEKPFGAGVDEALAYVASLGAELGFQVDRCDNYATELTYGEGKNTFDIYAHVDVVPVDKKNWTHDPFKLIKEGNSMYGRGSSDDKGPGLACLFACKALMDQGKLGGYKMRFIFGGNEESGSLCLEHYFHVLHKGYPTLGISPDADYPLIYAEKSIYSYRADYEVSLPSIPAFSCGNALNIVLAESSCCLPNSSQHLEMQLEDYLARHAEIQGRYEDGKLTFIGKPYHGSLPWNGVNAGLYMLDFLGEVYNCPLLHDVFLEYVHGDGSYFHGDFKDEHFADTSYNVGKITYENGKLSIFVNLRFSPLTDENEVFENLRTNTKANAIEVLSSSKGFIQDRNSDFIKMLMNAYQSETGDYASKPLAIGGGTYARDSENSVAFGAQFIGRDYRMHGNDEFFPYSDFVDNMQIYAHAIDDISQYLRDKE